MTKIYFKRKTKPSILYIVNDIDQNDWKELTMLFSNYIVNIIINIIDHILPISPKLQIRLYKVYISFTYFVFIVFIHDAFPIYDTNLLDALIFTIKFTA
jgi:hypothetical protein